MKKVNEVRKIVGVSKRTLQFYDEKGLLSVRRSKDNYRLYDEAALHRLWQILVYREMKFELDEIKEMLDLSEEERELYLERKMRSAAEHIHFLKEQIAFMDAVRRRGMPEFPGENGETTFAEHLNTLKRDWTAERSEILPEDGSGKGE